MQCGRFEIYTDYLAVYTLNMLLHFSTVEFNLIMTIAFLLMKKKPILLLPDNLISSDIKFWLLQGNKSNLINLKLPLMAVFISPSLLPQGKIIDHHGMGREPGPGAALQALTGLLGRCQPFVSECWPGSADGTGGYLQS